MKVIFEVFSTFASTVAIIDSEDLKLWPSFSGYTGHFLRWLDHVQDDRNTILVGLAYDADICIGSKSLNRPESF